MFKRIDASLEKAVLRAPFLLPWSIGCLLLGLLYWLIFWDADAEVGWRLFATALINAGTLWIVGIVFAAALRRLIPRRSYLTLLGLHLVAAGLFSISWYLFDISLLGWRDGSLVDGALIQPFRGPAFVWQLFQGVALYGAVAALVHLMMRKPAPVAEVTSDRKLPERLLLRTGDEMVTIEPGEIAAIIAADDYSEVRTAKGDHLVRRRLAAFEQELPANFVRVHRSAMVNLDRVVRAEPAGGGRIIVHLEGSEPVTASRAGARLLRERTL